MKQNLHAASFHSGLLGVSFSLLDRAVSIFSTLYIIIWQGSLEANPNVVIESFLVGILPYGTFPSKRP